MANWVTLPNGVHIDLDDPHNPITGDGSFSDLGGGNSSKDSKGSRSIDKYLDKNGHVTDSNRAAYEKHIDKYYKEAAQIVKNAGLKDENASYSHGLKVDYAKGKISESELISGFKEHQRVDFGKGDPTMSGKDSKSFDRDLELAFKEFDGDEDAILDALRSTGKDYGMSNSDLQAVVESYVLTHHNDEPDDVKVNSGHDYVIKGYEQNEAFIRQYNKEHGTKLYLDGNDIVNEEGETIGRMSNQGVWKNFITDHLNKMTKKGK